MVVPLMWHRPCRCHCMRRVVRREGERTGGARPIVVDLSLQGEQTQSRHCCHHCPHRRCWCSGAMVVVVAQVVLVVVVACVVLWGGRGRGRGGQGPLLSTRRCKVNRLSHGVVTIIVAIVVIDAVVQWWWWGGNTALSSWSLLLLLFQWYRWCYHAILVVIDLGAWWWWHGGMVALLLFWWHGWCHCAVVVINVVVQWWWWWHGVVVVLVAQVVPSCHRCCWRGGAMVVVVVTWHHCCHHRWCVGAVVVVTPRRHHHIGGIGGATMPSWSSRGGGSTAQGVTVGPDRNDRRPGDEGLSTKSLAYRRDESWRDDRRQGRVVWLTTGDSCRDFLRWMVDQGRSLSTRRPQRRAAKTSRKEERPGTKVRRQASTQKWDGWLRERLTREGTKGAIPGRSSLENTRYRW